MIPVRTVAIGAPLGLPSRALIGFAGRLRAHEPAVSRYAAAALFLSGFVTELHVVSA